MEDSTAKTIDFLRARLLAERSVSRTARQRANELAKRVGFLFNLMLKNLHRNAFSFLLPFLPTLESYIMFSAT